MGDPPSRRVESSGVFPARLAEKGFGFRAKEALLLAGVLAVVLTALPMPGAAGQAVIFPDKNLEATVRQAVGKPDGEIRESDLASLTRLDAAGKGITNLSGLEHCVALVELYLHRNQIVDLAPLAGLTKLNFLGLYGNLIVDVTPLAGLTKLNVLNLFDNLIVDITPLAGLTNLSELIISTNLAADITPLAGLMHLSQLWLTGNKIADLSPLRELVNLNILGLESNQIVDIAPVAGLRGLSHLDLGSNQVVDITPLTGLTNLNNLYLSRNRVSDISPLAGLTNLNRLHLGSNRVSDISSLVTNLGLSAEDEVDLGGNPLSETSISTYIPQLQARGVVILASLPPAAGVLVLGIFLFAGRGLFRDTSTSM